jgi:hypothetical protein
VVLHAEGLPEAVVRDQAPLNETALARVLEDGLTPSDWYRMLNSRVFFWVEEGRLERLLSARLYRDRAHTIIAVNTAQLLARHVEAATLCPINSGNTMMVQMPRGLSTFLPLDKYPFHERRRLGLTPVVELAVSGLIADIEDITQRVEHRPPGAAPQLVWAPA